MDIGEAREKIDEIDGKIAVLLRERMAVTDDIGRIKAASGTPIRDEAREKAVSDRAAAAAGEEYAGAVREIYGTIMKCSRMRQEKNRGQAMRLIVINGPNINMLGVREPDIYGRRTYGDLLEYIRGFCAELDLEADCFQSNHEGAIVDAIQDAAGKYDGIIINPAAYTHTSIAIPDALKAVAVPAAEVHLTDTDTREEYRRISYTAEACAATFKGLGFEGYRKAAEFLKENFG